MVEQACECILKMPPLGLAQMRANHIVIAVFLDVHASKVESARFDHARRQSNALRLFGKQLMARAKNQDGCYCVGTATAPKERIGADEVKVRQNGFIVNLPRNLMLISFSFFHFHKHKYRSASRE